MNHKNTQDIFVSVILPVFNGSQFIEEAITSILEQTHEHFEIIILDDGSTDETLTLVSRLKDSRISVYTESDNKGIVYQLNKGLTLSRGDMIARMDADDICVPNRFKKQIEFLLTHPKIQVLGSQAEKFGEVSKATNYPTEPGSIDYLLNYYCPVLHPSVMMRSSLFKERKFFYKNTPYAEDYQLWVDISDGTNIANHKDVLIKYRIHNRQTNRLKLSEQYEGALSARAAKLKKTFRFTSHAFQNYLNKIANDYIFYGSTAIDNCKPYIVKWPDRFFYEIHYMRGMGIRKPITEYVRKVLLE
jgi:glycosyltransferase involved in cell wall biosynthesis